MNIKRKIRVLVVDDSLIFRQLMVEGLSKDAGIEVVGTAADARTAMEKILELEPDVMTLDVELPKTNGVEFLKKLMPENPLPVVMVSSACEAVFDALRAGAVDFVAKPDSRGANIDAFINELVIKVKIASIAKIGKLKKAAKTQSNKSDNNASCAKKDVIIAIGASTGGTEATLEVLKNLPPEVPGIVIVQHMPPVFTKMYAERLNNICKIEVKEAQTGDLIRPGLALIAPGGMHLKVVRDRKGYFVKCFEGEKVNGHAPSVDVLFDSVASAAKDKAVGIILTGMGNDGAKGLLNMRKNGAFTIGQDEKSSVVYGMPMAAYNIGAVEKQCALDSIAGTMLRYLKEKNFL